MKAKFKVYKFVRMLECDVSSEEQAERVAQAMSEKYPNMLFEPHNESTYTAMIDVFDLGWHHFESVSNDSSVLSVPATTVELASHK